VECPRCSGNLLSLEGVTRELSRRLPRLFLRDSTGKLPIYGETTKFQDDPLLP
jgi:hypothetical protein